MRLQATPVAALDDFPYRQRSVTLMQQECPRFMTGLRTIGGLRIIPSSANFVMVELPSGCVTERIVSRLAQQGMLVRDCRTFSGMSKPALRLAIRHPRDNNGMVEALKKALSDRSSRSTED
jgi:threonine-phosphate decarboxylase